MTIETLFLTLGFNENERKVYLDLADVGKSTASMIAKRINIPRTTTYSILDSLEKKGLIAIEQKGNKTIFRVNQPESLLRMLKRDKEELFKRESAAKELIETIKPYFRTRNFSVPKLQFFEGKENVENMLYDQFSNWHPTILRSDKTWWGYQDHTFVEQYMPWLEWTWQRITPNEKILLFSNAAKIEKELKGKVRNREIRPLPDEYHFSTTIWAIGDYIVLIKTGEQPHYSFQINDPVFAENLRGMFNFLWNATTHR